MLVLWYSGHGNHDFVSLWKVCRLPSIAKSLPVSFLGITPLPVSGKHLHFSYMGVTHNPNVLNGRLHRQTMHNTQLDGVEARNLITFRKDIIQKSLTPAADTEHAGCRCVSDSRAHCIHSWKFASFWWRANGRGGPRDGGGGTWDIKSVLWFSNSLMPLNSWGLSVGMVTMVTPILPGQTLDRNG